MTDDFEQIVRRHGNAVCAVAYAVLRDRARSEEVAQDAFLVAWQKLPAMDPAPALPAWICGIAKNLALNARRRRREAVIESEPAADQRAAVDALIDRETADRVEQALGSLRAADREVVVLYYRGEQSLADVAAALAITEAAAKQRLHRGRERLKGALAAVEAALRASRPGAAFTAACVAALATGKTARAAPRRLPVVPIVAAALVVAAIGGGVAWRARSDDAEPAPRITNMPQITESAVARQLFRKLDPPARQALAELLVRRGARVASSRATPLPTSPAAPTKVYDFSGGNLADLPLAPVDGPLNKTTIRAAIRAMQPLLVECFEGSKTGKRGELSVTLHLSGAPDTPTLVDTVELAGPAIAGADPPLLECLRETLLSLELPAMEAVEYWDVHYPLIR